MRAPWGPAVWIFANHSRFLVLRHGTRCVTTPPAMETMTLQETPDIFQRRNDSTVIKACWSLSAKNCHCIKERANSDPFAIAVTVRWVDRRSQKISAVCWMRLRQNVNFVSRYWFRSLKTLCSASSTCRQQEIFKARKNLWRNFRELVCDCEKRENFRLYTVNGWHTWQNCCPCCRWELLCYSCARFPSACPRCYARGWSSTWSGLLGCEALLSQSTSGILAFSGRRNHVRMS